MKFYSIVLFLILKGQCFGQTNPKYIFFYKPYTDSMETNLYRDTAVKFDYTIQFKNIKNAEIEKDVKIAIAHSDFRIISISGYSYLFPGLEGGYKKNKDGTKTFISLASKYEGYIKKYGFKVIKGTSDAITPLQTVAYEYAKKYNSILLVKMKLKTKQ
jgi:hypothetical protein